MDTINEALALMQRHELETTLKQSGAVHVAEERELRSLQRRLARLPEATEGGGSGGKRAQTIYPRVKRLRFGGVGASRWCVSPLQLEHTGDCSGGNCGGSDRHEIN